MMMSENDSVGEAERSEQKGHNSKDGSCQKDYVRGLGYHSK